MKRMAKVRAFSVLVEIIDRKDSRYLVFDEDGPKAELQIEVQNSRKTSDYLGWADVELHRNGDALDVKLSDGTTSYVDRTHPSWSYMLSKYRPLFNKIEQQRRDEQDDH